MIGTSLSRAEICSRQRCWLRSIPLLSLRAWLSKVTVEQSSTSVSRFDYDFSELKTFGFADASPGYPEGMSVDLNWEEQMKKALAEQLVAYGCKRAADGRPDFLITCRAGTRERTFTHDISQEAELSLGEELFWGPSLKTETYEQIRALVTFLDGTTQRPFWRGTVSGTEDLQHSDKQIRNIAKKWADRFFKETRRGVQPITQLASQC